jgi:hypothetical protein
LKAAHHNKFTLQINMSQFQEAIDHCRWKRNLRTVIMSPELHNDNFRGLSFEEIFTRVNDLCENVRGVGILSVYDITSAICRHHNIIIDKVYLIGRGPKRAARLLNIKAKTKRIKNVPLKYIEISDIIDAFKIGKYKLEIESTDNGDHFETFLCNWQKGKPNVRIEVKI